MSHIYENEFNTIFMSIQELTKLIIASNDLFINTEIKIKILYFLRHSP